MPETVSHALVPLLIAARTGAARLLKISTKAIIMALHRLTLVFLIKDPPC